MAPARRGASLRALALRLRRVPGVRRVEVEHRFTPRLVPDDPGFTDQETTPGTPPGTPLQWWLVREGFPAAWDVTTGAGATVAIIDTGFDATHPDLAPRITRTVDLDGDDRASTAATVDTEGHGTHVASMACAAGGDGRGLAGAAYGCSLLLFRTDLSDSSVAASIVGATDAGAEAINMSFGTDGRTPAARVIVDAIDYAVARGVVLVAAAADDPVAEQGDPSNVLQPAGTGRDITKGRGLDVTAATANGTRASFAGYGSQVSMAAYGAWQTGGGGPRGLLGAFPANEVDLEEATSERPACDCRTTLRGDARYAYLQGTSMAAPQVAAVGALVRHLNPDLSAAQVIGLLKRTARRRPGGWTPELGWGILDAGNALSAARRADARRPQSSVAAPRAVGRRVVTLRVRTRDTAPPGCTASGVRYVDVFRRLGDGRFRRVARTARDAVRVRIPRGASASFYSVAVDRAGNREQRPRRADARVRVR